MARPTVLYERDRHVAVVEVEPREHRQSVFPADGPKLVSRRELVGCVERAKLRLELVAADPEDGRSAVGAEMAPGIFLTGSDLMVSE